jgi:transcription elongation factor Elf1
MIAARAKSPPAKRPFHLAIQWPECPQCGSVDLRVYATKRDDTGPTQYAKCGTCGARLVMTILNGDGHRLERRKNLQNVTTNW